MLGDSTQRRAASLIQRRIVILLGVLNDVTIGSNRGCGTKGFTAVPGWDWVTGLRTPSFPGHAGVVYGVALGVFLGVGF